MSENEILPPKMMDARDWIHNHPNTMTRKLPARVAAFQTGLVARGMVVVEFYMGEKRARCNCATCSAK